MSENRRESISFPEEVAPEEAVFIFDSSGTGTEFGVADEVVITVSVSRKCVFVGGCFLTAAMVIFWACSFLLSLDLPHRPRQPLEAPPRKMLSPFEWWIPF